MSRQPTYDPITKVWHGPSRDLLFNDSQNLGVLMLSVIKTTPDRVIQVCDESGAEMTCGEMYARSVKIANFLSTKIGLKHGDVVGIVSDNSENVTPIVLACMSLGLPINALATSMNETDMIYMYKMTKPKAIFSDNETIEKVQRAVDKIEVDDCKIFSLIKAVGGYQFVATIIKEEDDKVVEEFEFPTLDISSTPAIIMCSSGTTGMVKGILKTHKQLIHHYYCFFPTSHDREEIAFYPSGLHWISSVLVLGYITLCGFKNIVTSESALGNPELFMDIIDRYQVTYTVAIRCIGMKLLRSEKRRPMPSVRTVIVSGLVFTEEYIKNLQEIFPNANIVRVFSLTECVPLTAGWENEKLASSGRVVANTSLKVVDDNNNALDANKTGQICYKTLVNFSGYFGEPQKYAETVQADGWTFTGDLGYFDDEGFLYVVDRLKNLIKTKAADFTSIEVEEIIKTIEGVADCCVVPLLGVDDGNDAALAFVIKESNAENLTDTKILEIFNDRIYNKLKKITGGVHFVEKFHRTATGKINYTAMKKMALEIYEKRKVKTSVNRG